MISQSFGQKSKSKSEPQMAINNDRVKEEIADKEHFLLPSSGIRANRYLLKVVALNRESFIELAAVVAGVRRC